ncbi:MAG: hypothetical protein ACLQDV_25640 [Candidatus Binataceae bacterium]
MKIKFAFGLTVLAGLALAGLSAAASRQAQIVCSEDVIPENTAITATGTSPVCRGSCRARRVEPVRGSVMIICANQAIPKEYSLDSVTTTPDCQCLGDEDNAYVVKKLEVSEGEEEGEALATPTRTPVAAPTPTPWEPLPDFRTGE